MGPKERAKQLSAGTGVPAPYAVTWKTHVSDCRSVERLAHAKLNSHRVRSNREFFRLPVEVAIEVISAIAMPYRSPENVQAQRVESGEAVTRAEENPSASREADPRAPTPVSPRGLDIQFLSVESHAADEMAPRLRPDKLEVLRKLRAAVLRVAPDCRRMRSPAAAAAT